VSFNVAKGEVVAIVGGNGAGKTTLLKHFNGLLKPTSGSVKVFGQETKKQSIATLSRKVGLVFQNADHQLFSKTAEEEVLFGLKNFGFTAQDAAQKAAQTISYFGLDQLKLRVPFSLSGGEKKRLCIAAVMAWEPEVLVLDEPTVGQDFRSTQRIIGVIKQLVAAQKTVIIVSHDLEFLWPLKARTIVMKGGKVIADGDPQSIFFDVSLLDEAGLQAPQLVRMSRLLGNSKPFADNMEVLQWLAKR
jgi:energy-coupling factor transport system ATP-binding protein